MIIRDGKGISDVIAIYIALTSLRMNTEPLMDWSAI